MGTEETITGNNNPVLRKVLSKDRKKWSDVFKFGKLQKQGMACFYCKEKLELKGSTVDHKKPLAYGGLDVDSNIVISCSPCNQIKGHLNANSFIKLGGRGKRTVPFGYKPSGIKKAYHLMTLAKSMPEDSRNRDALLRILRGERVDISTYPRKVSETTGWDSGLSRVKKLAEKHPELICHDGDVYWLNKDAP